MAFFIDDLLFAPVKLVSWLGEKVDEAAHREMTDESRVREKLVEVQILYELGELTEDEYIREEIGLMEELEMIRKLKESESH